jgi:hypothetical protein
MVVTAALVSLTAPAAEVASRLQGVRQGVVPAAAAAAARRAFAGPGPHEHAADAAAAAAGPGRLRAAVAREAGDERHLRAH